MLPEIAEDQVREQVRRIAASAGFVAADSIRRFLDFTVEKTLAGHGGEIKEFTIGLEVFGRKASFDPQLDSIVRVQARKLRERLQAYYESEGAREPFRIEYRKGSYVPHFVPCAAEGAPSRTLAVLPFLNLGSDKERGFIGDGIAEELIFLLSRVERLRVVSRSSSFALRGGNDDVKAIGRRLNADLIVEGSVRQSGDRLRVTAQLINVEDGYHLWSERWERGMDGVVEIEDELAAAIAKSLRPHMIAPAADSPARDAHAHRLYLQGRYLWNQRTEHGFQRAIECYKTAIERDPRFARAWAALADTYVLMAAHQLESTSESMPKARHAALTALTLDARLAGAHCALGSVLMSFDWNFEAAQREWRLALEIDPNHAYAWHSLAVFGSMQRCTEDALAAMRQAQRLEPLSAPIANDFGFVYYSGRRYQEAVEACRKAIDLHPSFYRTYVNLGRTQAALGSYEQAIRTCLAARPLLTGRAFLGHLMATLGYSYGRLGRQTEALAVIAELEEMGQRHYVSRYDVALIQTGQGRLENAMQSLEEAFHQRAFWLMDLPCEPLFDDLRADPRFTAMCEAVRKPRPIHEEAASC